MLLPQRHALRTQPHPPCPAHRQQVLRARYRTYIGLSTGAARRQPAAGMPEL